MGFDIRVLPEEDVERWKHVNAVAFMDPPDTVDRWAKYLEAQWTLGAYADGALQASATSAPFVLGLEGSPVRMGAVTSVACMPEYRRKGLVAELLRETLKRSRDLEEPLSGLWTPHPGLYRRYGWEICTDVDHHSFDPKHVTLSAGPNPGGRIERRMTDDWRLADGVYKQWAALRNSVVLRDERRWRSVLDFSPDADFYVYRDESGEAEGYARMRTRQESGAPHLQVNELVTVSGEAYRALLGLVLSHDLVTKAHVWTAGDEPLLDIIENPEQVKRERQYGLFLRVVDVAEAFGKRPAYGEGRIAVRVIDQTCPWNDGLWEFSSVGSYMAAERCDDEPMLTVDARALAQLFNGFRSASNLARVGRIQVHHPRALALADILFAMRSQPSCLDEF